MSAAAGPDIGAGIETDIRTGRGTDSPFADLLALNAAGRLAAEYPAVRPLVAALTGQDLLTAGRLLARVDPADVLREHPGTPAVSVAITGHGTLSMLVAPLTARLAGHGVLLRPTLGNYDGYVFELSDPAPDGLGAATADLALCVLDPMVVFDEVPVPWRPQDVEKVLAEKAALIEGLAARFTAAARGTLVLNTLPLPRRFTAQLIDHRSRARLGAVWHEANARLLQLGAEHAGVVAIDLDPLLAEGVPAYEPRVGVYARAHLSPDLLAAYAHEVSHLALNRVGRTKKVLALDLDNTLWGGILGDDGVEGIEVAGTLRGEAFKAVQQAAKQLGSQGVLLAAVSKNDTATVSRALSEHPEMTLREEDFVRVTANWEPKHENLARLAEALNLSVDGIVFADDSAFECGLVRRELPGVAVIHLDGDPAEHVGRLLADGWFDVPELTAEDRTRTGKYRDELVRSDFRHSFASIEDYLRELDVSVRLSTAGEADLARVSQLTLRTNQFNLTTRRMQPAELRALAADPQALVLAIRSADRFGDNGLVGALLARREPDGLHIDNFVLSCRVFSRGIEQACLATVLQHARDTGAGAVVGTYRPTAKNGIVADLFPRFGFHGTGPDGADGADEADEADAAAEAEAEAEGTDDTAGTSTYRHDLVAALSAPAHIRLSVDLERHPA
ncbi:FkbH-like protein [Catenulispora sp. MAP5-51]